MPQITLNKKQLDQFAAFIRKHDVKKWFLAKDQGAYVGATAGEGDTFENIIFYFKGMDPNKDGEFYDNAMYAFGGDDFGEHFDADIILKLADDPLTTKMVLNVGASSISIKSWAKPAPKNVEQPKPAAPKKPQPKAAKRSIASVAYDAIAEGLDNEAVLQRILAEFPNAKTNINCVRWYRNKAA
jgi:hypothetical protein